MTEQRIDCAACGAVYLESTGDCPFCKDAELERLRAENERLQALFQATRGAHWSWVAKGEELRVENERLVDRREEQTRRAEAAERAQAEAAGHVLELRAEVERLREALAVIALCPPQAVHSMPLAAQTALYGAELSESKEQSNG